MPASANSTPAQTTDKRTVSLTLKVTAVLATIWVLSLIALAIFTANPILVNRQQIAEADSVLTGTFVDFSTEQGVLSATLIVQIVHKNLDQKVAERINVNLPEEMEISPEKSYVVPVTHIHRDLYRVTPTKAGYKLRTIYPATEEINRQLAEMLGTGN